KPPGCPVGTRCSPSEGSKASRASLNCGSSRVETPYRSSRSSTDSRHGVSAWMLGPRRKRCSRICTENPCLESGTRALRPRPRVLVQLVERALARAVAQHAAGAHRAVGVDRGHDPVAQHLLLVAREHAEHLGALALDQAPEAALLDFLAALDPAGAFQRAQEG